MQRSSLLDCCDLVVFFVVDFFSFFFLFFTSGRLPFGFLRCFSCFVSFIWCQLFACLIRAAIFRLPPAFVVCSFFLCHRHLWSGLSFFATGICGLVFLSLPLAFVVCSFFLCHWHLWSGLSFFVTGICSLFFPCFLSLPQAFVYNFFLSRPFQP